MTKELFIIAGEASGDMHGASLIKEVKNIFPEINISGIGGPLMIESGLEAIYHIKDLSFLGFAEVIKHIPFIRKVQKDAIKHIEERNIDTVVLIDYPGFNLSIARKLKKRGIKIIYYISPQLWAWGRGRVKKIKKYVDKMLVLFPFEKEFYKNYGIDVEFVGHPLIDRINNYNFIPKDEFFKKHNIPLEKEILLIMPGSRNNEIEKIFPEIIKAAEKISRKYNLEPIVAISSNIDKSKIYELNKYNFKLIQNETYELFKYSKFGIIKSGTSTLEAGLFQLPCVVVYITNNLTYKIAKRLIKIDKIALLNIVAGKKIVTELIQDEVNEKRIVEEISLVMDDNERYSGMKQEMENIKTKIGKPGASLRAAEIVCKEIYAN